MAGMVSPESIALSQQFFTRHDTYGAFDLTSDKKNIVGCIEPRDQAHVIHGEYKTIMQTGGGAAGEGLDGALAMTVIGGALVPVETGMESDNDERPLTVFGAHHDCAFIGNLAAVTHEMAHPSDFTKESLDRWTRYLNEKERVAGALGSVMMAAAIMAEYLGENGNMDHLVQHADGLYPEHANVVHVKGPSLSRVYVVGLHPNVGKNRNMKPSDPTEAVKIQGYHDSLAATIDNLHRARKMSEEMKGLRITSMVLRAAATRTVISSGKPEMTFLEVTPANTKSGIKITEQSGPK